MSIVVGVGHSQTMEEVQHGFNFILMLLSVHMCLVASVPV